MSRSSSSNQACISTLGCMSPLDSEGSLQPIYNRPGHGTKGANVNLLVNFFKLQLQPRLAKLYEYNVSIVDFKVVRRGTEPVPAEVLNRETVRSAFWDAVRASPQLFPDVDGVVFDDRKTAWTTHRLQGRSDVIQLPELPHPDPKKSQKFRVLVALTLQDVFDWNIVTDDVALENRSKMFMKNLLTQRARFAPPIDDAEWQFTSSWEARGGSVFSIPRSPMAVDYNEIRVCPGVRAWLGLYASIRAIENLDPVVNFGLVNRLFYTMNMDLPTFYAELICKMDKDPNWRDKLRECGMNEIQRNRLSAAICGLRVRAGGVMFGNRRPGALVRKQIKKGVEGNLIMADRHYTIRGVERDNSRMRRLFNGASYEEAYHHFGFPLHFPFLPLIKVRQGDKVEYQPMEVLFLHDRPQKFIGMLDFFSRRRYVEGATRDPNTYKQLTDKMVDSLGVARSIRDVPFLSKFGVTMDVEMMKCRGSVLDAPVLRNKSGDLVEMQPDRSFRVNTFNAVPKHIVIAIIMMYSPETGTPLFGSDEETEKFVEKFYETLRLKSIERGMVISLDQVYKRAQAYSTIPAMRACPRDMLTPQIAKVYHIVPEVPTIWKLAKYEQDRFGEKYSSDTHSHMVLVVTDRLYNLYGHIKHVCDVEVGIASQIINKDTIIEAIERGKNSVYYHILQKMNGKLGGVAVAADPVVLEDRDNASPSPDQAKSDHVMYVGIDVTHPSPGSGIDISIASIVANVDLGATRYTSEIYAQMKAKETVECFDSQFQELMIRFHEENDCFPKHVVVYRDGVSDSQLRSTACCEINWIKETWLEISTNSDPDHVRDVSVMPTFTYIVVQKRHVTRFIVPVVDEKNETTYENMPSGTVVDSGVSSPTMFDFWLASQHGAIGTTRPAHYTVVFDEWARTPDEIYEMTYRLCFLQSRCEKPVSLPAPVYYAHLVCEKAKEWYKHTLKTGLVVPLPQPEAVPENAPAIDCAAHEEKEERFLADMSIQKMHIEKVLRAKLTGMHFL